MTTTFPAPLLSHLIGTSAPLIPVLHVENADHAEPLAEALVGGGLVVLEVTLRTANALKVIERMRKRTPDALIGAGTLTKPEHFRQVKDAGALFAVSPALTERLAEGAAGSGLPFIPGAATPSEVLIARECGFTELKFFPADLLGGTAGLKHLAPLYPDIRFCPTGGISDDNVNGYLGLDNVFAAGGAWLAPRDLIETADWLALTYRARRSVGVAQAG